MHISDISYIKFHWSSLKFPQKRKKEKKTQEKRMINLEIMNRKKIDIERIEKFLNNFDIE